MQFSDLHLNPSILKVLSEERYHKATLVQQKVIPLVLDKKDVIVGSQTGSGKTAAFALPIIHHLAEEQKFGTRTKENKSFNYKPYP